MNKKSKILLSSIATIAMCASVATGATYALFTSESEVSIAVTSGTVDVRATASELSLYTDGEAQNGAFALGGTATKNGNIIKIERMMPMDSVNFDIVIENYSDVTVQYRTVINNVSDTGLFSALEVTFTEGETEQVFKGGYSYADWATLEPEDTDKDTAEAVKTINVNIEFPDGANQNGYQGKSCEIAVTVEAVQGNADVVNPVTQVGERAWEVNSEEGMMLVNGLINSTWHGEDNRLDFTLKADMDMTGYTWTPLTMHHVNLNGANHKISNLDCSVNRAAKSGLFAYMGASNVKDLTIENVKVAGEQAGVLVGLLERGVIENVTIAGTNTVAYKDFAYNEAWGGIGAVIGVNISGETDFSGITIADSAKIAVDYNGMVSQFSNTGDGYCFNEAVTLKNNGTVTAHGVWYQIISDGFMRSSEGEYVITNKAGLFYLAEQVNGGKAYSGETVKLLNNIDLENEAWTPIGHDGNRSGFQGVFNGDNHTISNLYVDLTATRAYQSAGLFGSTSYATLKDFTVVNATIKNLDDAGNTDNGAAVVVGAAQFQSTISNVDVINATVEGNRRVSAIAGYFVGTIENCDVTNVTLTATVDELTDGSYDNGDKVGGIIAYSNGASTIKNNTVTNATIGGYRDVGGIAGYATTSTLTGNKVEGLTLVVNTEHNYKNYGTIDEHDVNAIIGEQGDAVLENNTESGVEYVYEYAVKTQDALSSAMTDGANVSITLDAGEYTIPSNVQNSNIVIKGTTDTVVNMSNGTYLDKSNIAFEGVTIKLGLGYVNGGTGSDYTALYSKNATFTNCTFEGGLRVGRDGAKFIGCTFNLYDAYDYVYTYGNDVEFINCTFNATQGKALIVYSDGNGDISKVNVTDCTFNATQGGTADAIASQYCAAVEINNYGCGVDLTLTDNVVGENFSGEWRIKSYNDNGNTVTVNGVEYASLALDGTVMELDAYKNVKLNGVWYIANESGLLRALQENVETINVQLFKSIDCYLNTGIGGADTKAVYISGASKDVMLNITCASASYNGSYVTYRTINPEAVMHFSNITLEKSKWTAQTWNTYNIEFYTAANITDCVITHPVTFCNGNTYTMTNTVIDSSNDTGNTFYSVWVEAGANVTITGCEIIGNRGVKADGQYVSYPGDSGYGADDHDETVTKLAISDTKFALTGSKSAVLVKLEKANVVLNNVTVENATTNNALVWIDEDAPMSHTEFAVSVTVDGTVCDNINIIEP